RPPSSTLLPYTTLFRSLGARPASSPASRARRHSTRCEEYRPSRRRRAPSSPRSHASASLRILRLYSAVNLRRLAFAVTSVGGRRSEEHTSELQSRENLV